MNKTTEALKLAEEALETAPIEYDFHGEPVDKEFAELSNKALAAIREALAEQEKQEPVAWMWVCVDVESRSIETGLLFNRGADDENTDWTPLYAAPVSAPAQEPVAVISESAIGLVKLHANGVSLPFGTPLYAAPVSVEAAVLAEREACAKVCDGIERRKWEIVTQGGQMDGIMPRDCAVAIRARGEK